MRNRKLRAMAEGAVLLALALVFNALKLFTLPNGGSVDLAMIPIFIFALRWGVGWGLLEGFLFGLLQMLIDAPSPGAGRVCCSTTSWPSRRWASRASSAARARAFTWASCSAALCASSCTTSQASPSTPSRCRLSSSASSGPRPRRTRSSTTAATCSSTPSSASSSSACSTSRWTSTSRPGTSGPERKGTRPLWRVPFFMCRSLWLSAR